MSIFYVDVQNGLDSRNSVQAQSPATPVKSLCTPFANGWVQWGDTIYLRAGTYSGTLDTGGLFTTSGGKQIVLKNQVGGTVGEVKILAYPGESVTIDMPTVAQTTSGYLFDSYGTFTLGGSNPTSKLSITNTQSSTAYIVGLARAGVQITTNIQNALLDGNNTASYFPFLVGSAITDYDPVFNFIRCELKNYESSAVGYPIVRAQAGSGRKTTVNFEVCKIHGIGYLVNRSANGLDVNVKNCTAVKGKKSYFMASLDGSSLVSVKNSILCADSTFTSPIFAEALTYAQVAANWDIAHNVFYYAGIEAAMKSPGTQMEALAKNGSGPTSIFPIDANNFFIEPKFTDYTAGDYTIQAGSYISGRGDATILPVGGDFDGNAWAGADIGCYRNPSAVKLSPSLITRGICFVGDSIALGSGVAAQSLSLPLTVLDSGPSDGSVAHAAQGGSSGVAVKFQIDRAAILYRPQYIAIQTWHNNTGAATYTPSTLNTTQIADEVESIIAHCAEWGITPIFLEQLGVATAIGAGQTNLPTANNAAIRDTVLSLGFKMFYPLQRMRLNSSWNLQEADGGYYQPATGLAGNVHPAASGYALVANELKFALYGVQFGPWSTCDGILPLSAQPCKSHALPIGVGKITIFEGIATTAQIEEAAG